MKSQRGDKPLRTAWYRQAFEYATTMAVSVIIRDGECLSEGWRVVRVRNYGKGDQNVQWAVAMVRGRLCGPHSSSHLTYQGNTRPATVNESTE